MTDILYARRYVPLRIVNPDETLGAADKCLFRYCTAEPWAVKLVFGDAGCKVEWLMDRETLARGVEFEDGYGDIYVKAYSDGVHITLFPPGDEPAVFSFDRDELVEFLDETWRLVEEGSEEAHFDLPDDVIGSVEMAGDY